MNTNSVLSAQSKAAQAFGRLLNLAECRNSGQTRHIAQFMAATYDGSAFSFDLFDLFDLRVLEVAISDDLLCCLDALRWGRADLYQLVPDGDKRMQAVIAQWRLRPIST
jgi:hypothetical protein